MKHVLVFAAITVAIVVLLTHKSDLDLLMEPATRYSEAQTGNRFVDKASLHLPMDARDLAERGVISVVYFHDETCPGCRQLDDNIASFLRVRPDVAVRKVAITVGKDAYMDDIRNFRWRIYMTPCILIFGKNGKLIAADDRTDAAGQNLLEKWMDAELRKDYDKHHRS